MERHCIVRLGRVPSSGSLRSRSWRQARTTALAGLITCTVWSTHAIAGCAAFNGSYGPNFASSGTSSSSGFTAGDVITLTVSVGGGHVILSDDTTSTNLITQSTVGSQSYTVTSTTASHDFSLPYSMNSSFTASWTCTPAAQPQQQSTPSKSPQVTAQQSGQRVQAILTNQLGSSRQVDRLMDFGSSNSGNSSGTPGAAFTADEKRALDFVTGTATAPRLGLGMTGGISNGTPLNAQLGLRSTYDDDLTSPMRTRGPNYEAERGGGMSFAGLNLSGSESGSAYSFSTSLRDVARAAQHQDAQRLADDPTAAALGFTSARSRALDNRANPLDVWIEGRFMRLNDGRNGADISGHSGLFGTGVDYVFNRSLLAGVSLSYDVSGQKSSAAGTEARGTGWLVGPYATARLGPNLFWQSRAAWGRANNDVSPNLTVTDSFGSTRWLALTKLTGRFQMGAWQLRPSASVAYMEEVSDRYVSGTGTAVESVKTRVGTASAGPEISYQYRLNPHVLIEPRAGIEAIWTFARDISVGGNSAIVGGEAIGPEGVRGRAELGLRTVIVGGTVIDLSGSYDGIGAGDYNTVTGRAVLRVPLN